MEFQLTYMYYKEKGERAWDLKKERKKAMCEFCIYPLAKLCITSHSLIMNKCNTSTDFISFSTPPPPPPKLIQCFSWGSVHLRLTHLLVSNNNYHYNIISTTNLNFQLFPLPKHQEFSYLWWLER